MARAMMKARVLAPLLLVVLSDCNLLKKTGDAADGGAATADSTGTTGATAPTSPPSVLDKALSFLSGGPFEGEITMTTSGGGNDQTHTVVYLVKGQKMRFNTPVRAPGGGNAYVIVDSSTKKMISVTDSNKTAMVMDMNNNPMNPAGGAQAALAAAAPKATVDKTGKTDTVAGYSCDVWKATSDNGDHSDLCVAKGISFPDFGTKQVWTSYLGDGFPLRAVTTDAAGKEKHRMDVTKIDKKSVDDSQFAVPAGYKTMDMGDMMKNLGAMGGRVPH
jgi:Domain of unknown function (DUF4412)